MAKNKTDLTNLIIKDKNGRRFLAKIFYSRVILSFFIIALQISIFILFCVRLNPHIEYYYGTSIGLSAIFMIYLSNSRGRNEFKITWLLPLVIFPLFGVSAYLMYHGNYGGRYYRKRMNKINDKLKGFYPPEEGFSKLLEKAEIEDLGKYLLRVGKFYPYQNNQLEYFESGEVFFDELCRSLEKAKSFIFLEFFIIGVDESWNKILRILEKKVKEGVKVRIIYDGIGSVAAAQSSYQKYLESKGIEAHVFLPVIPFFSTQINNRDHRKIVLIDSEIAFTGGLNLSNEYFNYGKNRFAYWKDNAIKISGPAAVSFTRMFLQTWNLQSKKEEDFAYFLHGGQKTYESKGLIIPYADDAFNKIDIAENVYLYLINHAKKSLDITTPYLLIDNHLLTDLIFAVQRGVRVRIAVPSIPDHFTTFCIGKTFQYDLMKNGVEIYEYQKGFIHSKTFVCDGKIATIGSINLDYRSLYHHFECGCLLYKNDVVKEMQEDFNQIVKDSSLMTCESYKKSPAIRKFAGRALRIFAPLL